MLSEVKNYFDWRDSINEIKTIEYQHKEQMDILNWNDDRDVLYSFLGIYAIGVWVYNKNNEKIRITPYFIFVGNKRQSLYSYKFLKRIQTEKLYKIDVTELNRNEALKKFLNVYMDLGNLYPIWPGGNTKKGKVHGCFDIPELFFRRYKEWFNALKEIYKKNCYLDCINPSEKRYESLASFLESVNTEIKYTDFVYKVIENIELRNELLKKDTAFDRSL